MEALNLEFKIKKPEKKLPRPAQQGFPRAELLRSRIEARIGRVVLYPAQRGSDNSPPTHLASMG
jgi:hypothetical protein